MFIVCLSSMAGKIKRGQKLLTVIYLVGQFKRKAESCLLFVYPTGSESFKERHKVVYGLFIRQGQKGKKKSKRLLLFVNRQGREV